MQLTILDWAKLSQTERRSALRRPAQAGADALHQRVSEIVKEVRERGDEALLEFTRRFDGVSLTSLEVSAAEFANDAHAENQIA